MRFGGGEAVLWEMQHDPPADGITRQTSKFEILNEEGVGDTAKMSVARRLIVAQLQRRPPFSRTL